MMKKIILFFILVILSGVLYADEILKNDSSFYYYNNLFGNLHQNPSDYSSSLTTISCGQAVRIISKEKLAINWLEVKAGPYKGFIKEDFLTNVRPVCFQDKFPKFFEYFEIDMGQIYLWGRLYDLYLQGESTSREKN